MANDVSRVYRHKSELMKENPPTISVVLPCYNTHVHLSQAIDSVLAQTFPHIEIIVVDDGSSNTDTLEFLNNRLPSDVRLVRQNNKGLSAARNAGFAAARGEYVLP